MTRDKLATHLITLSKEYPVNHTMFNRIMEYFSDTGRTLPTDETKVYYDTLLGCLMMQCGTMWLGVESDGHIHS